MPVHATDKHPADTVADDASCSCTGLHDTANINSLTAGLTEPLPSRGRRRLFEAFRFYPI